MNKQPFFEYSISQIVEKYYDMMFYLALARVKNEDDAKDIVQDAFTVLVKHNDDNKKFNSEEHLKAWLIKVTIFCSQKFMKKFHRETAVSEDMLLETYDMNDENIAVYNAVMKLSPQHRTIVYLHYYQGYKLKEIAQMLDKTYDSVQSMLKNAKKKLRQFLSEEDINV